MAKINVFLHPDAMDEYIASYAWYYEKGTHLAAEFERENRACEAGCEPSSRAEYPASGQAA